MGKIGYLRNSHDNIIEDEKAKINNNYGVQNTTSINLKQFEGKIRFISKNLPKEYLEKFIVSLLFSIQKSIENNNTDEFEQNLADWEFTAEIESSPNLKKEITDAIKEGPSMNSISLNDALREIRK